MGSREAEGAGGVTLLGCPLDATSSFRGGTRFAPESIRKASWTLETYSPYLKRDLDEWRSMMPATSSFVTGDPEYSLELIEGAAAETVGKGKKLLVLGGEHLITYPILKAVKRHFGDMQIVHFDAHCDLRDDYEGQRLSHATVMKRVKELGDPGDPSGRDTIRDRDRNSKSSFSSIRRHRLRPACRPHTPVYVSFDMDVFDPSLVPGVTTPEPGGLMFNESWSTFLFSQGVSSSAQT